MYLFQGWLHLIHETLDTFWIEAKSVNIPNHMAESEELIQRVACFF